MAIYASLSQKLYILVKSFCDKIKENSYALYCHAICPCIHLFLKLTTKFFHIILLVIVSFVTTRVSNIWIG